MGKCIVTLLLPRFSYNFQQDRRVCKDYHEQGDKVHGRHGENGVHSDVLRGREE